MRWSSVRLVVSSVLVVWGLTFVALLVYGQTLHWDEDRARRDGVFFVYDELKVIHPDERAARLDALRPHFGVGFRLADEALLEEVLGPEHQTPATAVRRVRHRAEWWVVPLGAGEPVLLAGPVDPQAPPPGYLPVGLLMGILALPLLATMMVLRVDRGVSRVEEATVALAQGELGARVDASGGPAQELSVRFNAMADRIEQLIRSRDELVQAISHELGSPLTRLRFHLELLESDVPDDVRAGRAAMARQLDSLEELVAELLTFVQAEDRVIECVEFLPDRDLVDLVELAQLSLPDERDLEVSLMGARDVGVFADRRLFLRAVENILRNAVRHASSKVRVGVGARPSGVAVWVDDDGPGISPDQRERVLEPFIRLEADRGRGTGGAGLGLAIVQRIVQRHGGTVVVGDSPLGGARVTTTWPSRG
jgi:two-component system sensor kinase ParS